LTVFSNFTYEVNDLTNLQEFGNVVRTSLRFNDYLENHIFFPGFFSRIPFYGCCNRRHTLEREICDEWKRRGVIGTTKRDHVAIKISRSRSVTRITLFSLWNNAREVRSWDSVIEPLYISMRLGQLRARIFETRARPGDGDCRWKYWSW